MAEAPAVVEMAEGEGQAQGGEAAQGGAPGPFIHWHIFSDATAAVNFGTRNAYQTFRAAARALKRSVTHSIPNAGATHETDNACFKAIITAHDNIRGTGANAHHYSSKYRVIQHPVARMAKGTNPATKKYNDFWYQATQADPDGNMPADWKTSRWPWVEIPVFVPGGEGAYLHVVKVNLVGLTEWYIRSVDISDVTLGPKGRAESTKLERMDAALGRAGAEAYSLESLFYQKKARVGNFRTSDKALRAMDARTANMPQSLKQKYALASGPGMLIKKLTTLSGKIRSAAQKDKGNLQKIFNRTLQQLKSTFASANQKTIVDNLFVNYELTSSTNEFIRVLTGSMIHVKPKVGNFFFAPLDYEEHGDAKGIFTAFNLCAATHLTVNHSFIPAIDCFGLHAESQEMLTFLFGRPCPSRGDTNTRDHWAPVKLGTSHAGERFTLHASWVIPRMAPPMKGSPSTVHGGSQEAYYVPAVNLVRPKLDTVAGLTGDLTLEQAWTGLAEEIEENKNSKWEGHGASGWTWDAVGKVAQDAVNLEQKVNFKTLEEKDVPEAPLAARLATRAPKRDATPLDFDEGKRARPGTSRMM